MEIKEFFDKLYERYNNNENIISFSLIKKDNKICILSQDRMIYIDYTEYLTKNVFRIHEKLIMPTPHGLRSFGFEYPIKSNKIEELFDTLDKFFTERNQTTEVKENTFDFKE